jgi:hypothetical protein
MEGGILSATVTKNVHDFCSDPRLTAVQDTDDVVPTAKE